MRTRNVEILVGIFLVAGMLAVLALAVNVSGYSGANSDTYKVYAHFDNIGGLTNKAEVTLAGVQIGTVTDISIDSQLLVAKVEMEIFSEVNYLSIDSSVQILTSGLLGGKYIGLSVGAEEEVLVDGSLIEDSQSALVLEELIGKFLFDKVSD
ncbi:MAG: outer membrane lipid asymmetry maintenance protein MlaD [Oceanospirillaceae bacterium]|nr:outer membrane lipid asymmetry maintenance protein MlaD [Oceanospirillaceae bacterium]